MQAESGMDYKDILDYAYDWETWEDESGVLRYVSPACERISGYVVNDFLQDNQLFASIVLDEDKPKWAAHRHAIKNLPGYHMEQLRIIRKDGEIVWIEHHCQPVIDQTGAYVGYRANNRDITAQKKTEEALQKNEQQFQRIIESVPFSLTIISTEGKVLYVNSKSLELFDLKEEDVIGKTLAPLLWIEPEQRDAWLKKISEDGYVKNFEMHLRSRSGKEFWAIGSGMHVDYQGESCILSTQHDITARKQAEEALKQSEEKYRLLFENATESIVVTQNGKLQIFNPMAMALTGYTAKELECANFLDFIHPDDREQVRKNNQLRLEGKPVASSYVFRLLRKDGPSRWVESNSLRIDWQGSPATLNFLIDITERHEAETALKASEKQLQTIINTIPDGLVVTALDGTIRSASPKFISMWGYDSPKEIVGKNMLEFIHPDESAKAAFFFNERLKGHETGTEEYRMVRKNGSSFIAEANGNFLRDPEGKPTGILYVDRDISERKEIGEELRKSEAKYRLLTEFASDVIWVLNLNTKRFTYISPSILLLRGFTAEEAMAQTMEESLAEESVTVVKEALAGSLQNFIDNPDTPQHYINEVRQPCKNGSIIWVEISTRYRYNDAGEIEVVGVSRNIDKRKRVESEVRYLSYHDQMTGLYNRRFYEEELQRLDKPENLPITLIMADVNGLKLTNDAFGHRTGDTLLKTIAAILLEECRENDVIARIGGDEFIILLPQTNTVQAGVIVRRMQDSLKIAQTGKLILSVSFGSGTKENEEKDINTIYTQAEDHMYRRKLSESRSMKSETIKLITQSLYQKDNLAKAHSENVSRLCRELGAAIGLEQDELDELAVAGLLHDIGKIGIDETILAKNGPLDDKELAEIHRHSETGYQILRSATEFARVAEWVLAQHERPDGSGYPRKLKNENIPLQSKILSIVDAYDAMTSESIYKTAMPEERAIAELKRCSGKQFDPALVQTFIRKVIKA